MRTMTRLARRHAPLSAAALALAAAAATLATPTTATACGGFFCNQQPIDQAGEQIVFTVAGDQIQATIQISYSGEAKDFAWVIPVASKPTLSVGSQALFTRLDQFTRPQFYLQWDNSDGQCGGWWMWEADAAAGGPPAPSNDDGVQVVAQEEVGPYQTVTLDSDDADALVKWLNDNDFDQPAESLPLIEHYVAQDMLFVALKLKQDAGVGDIQPIVLEFQEQSPCVPLVLTQIAALPDMPVRLWIFGESRAVPSNWFHVVINHKKIDWLNGGANYSDLVTQAVDEAAGHGFVTEYAGTSEVLKEQLYKEGQYDIAKLAAISDPGDFMEEIMAQQFPADSVLRGLLRKYIPMPQSLVDEGVSENQFYNSLSNYEYALPEDYALDGAAFAAELDDKVVTPLKNAQTAIDRHRYMTRLYTTVSPDEMNRDPLFHMNPDLPDVSNVHTASGKAECGDDGQVAKIVITLESGETVEIPGPFDNWWSVPVADYAPNEPAAARIELVGATGEPTLVDPTKARQVDGRLDKSTPIQVISELEPFTPPATPGPGGTAKSTGGCAGGAAGGLGLALAGLALAGLRRRRDA